MLLYLSACPVHRSRSSPYHLGSLLSAIALVLACLHFAPEYVLLCYGSRLYLTMPPSLDGSLFSGLASQVLATRSCKEKWRMNQFF